jgi:hypothetical protein
MRNNIRDLKIVPINWIDEAERWIVVPGNPRGKHRRRTREIIYAKNRCFFTTGVPKNLIDFVYRSVRQLNLSDQTLIFSRGTVRTSKGLVRNAVSIRDLDWGVGLLITIPRILKYREMITRTVDSTDFSLRLMELVVLHGLLQIAYPRKRATFYSNNAVLIIAKGWYVFQNHSRLQ